MKGVLQGGKPSGGCLGSAEEMRSSSTTRVSGLWTQQTSDRPTACSLSQASADCEGLSVGQPDAWVTSSTCLCCREHDQLLEQCVHTSGVADWCGRHWWVSLAFTHEPRLGRLTHMHTWRRPEGVLTAQRMGLRESAVASSASPNPNQRWLDRHGGPERQAGVCETAAQATHEPLPSHDEQPVCVHSPGSNRMAATCFLTAHRQRPPQVGDDRGIAMACMTVSLGHGSAETIHGAHIHAGQQQKLSHAKSKLHALDQEPRCQLKVHARSRVACRNPGASAHLCDGPGKAELVCREFAEARHNPTAGGHRQQLDLNAAHPSAGGIEEQEVRCATTDTSACSGGTPIAIIHLLPTPSSTWCKGLPDCHAFHDPPPHPCHVTVHQLAGRMLCETGVFCERGVSRVLCPWECPLSGHLHTVTSLWTAPSWLPSP